MKETKKTQKKSTSENCDDPKCAIHGKLSTRGRIFTGEVISDSANKTVTVTWQRLFSLPKYERFEKRRTKIKAYNPLCISAKKGDKVKIEECRKLSKTKSFVVTEVVK